MDVKSVISPEIGNRVWTVNGLKQHGPIDGPKTDVPANTGGVITKTTKPYSSMDFMLYEVRWDTGQHTKHYYKELFSIGPFQTLQNFEQAIQATGKDAKLVLGPQGGLREFTMSLQHQGKQYILSLTQEQGRIWAYLQLILERNSIQIAVEKLAPIPRAPRQKKSSLDELLRGPKKNLKKSNSSS